MRATHTERERIKRKNHAMRAAHTEMLKPSIIHLIWKSMTFLCLSAKTPFMQCLVYSVVKGDLPCALQNPWKWLHLTLDSDVPSVTLRSNHHTPLLPICCIAVSSIRLPYKTLPGSTGNAFQPLRCSSRKCWSYLRRGTPWFSGHFLPLPTQGFALQN